MRNDWSVPAGAFLPDDTDNAVAAMLADTRETWFDSPLFSREQGESGPTEWRTRRCKRENTLRHATDFSPWPNMPKHIDLREQRLQEWAEKYFIPVKEHSTNWHPTVLEEMALKDFAEQRRRSTVSDSMTGGCMTQLNAQWSQEVAWPQEQYVPLAPTETGRRIDRTHSELRGPKFLQPTPEPIVHTELYLG